MRDILCIVVGARAYVLAALIALACSEPGAVEDATGEAAEIVEHLDGKVSTDVPDTEGGEGDSSTGVATCLGVGDGHTQAGTDAKP